MSGPTLPAEARYVCRLYKPHHRGKPGVQVMRCEDCGKLVVATPAVLTDRRRHARKLSLPLIVCCDDCAVPPGDGRPLVVVTPSEDEIRAARRLTEGV